MKPLLVILNPRRIDECIRSFQALDIARAWLTGYTESELEEVFPRVVEDTAYSHYVVVSDDVVATQAALDAVLRLLDQHPVVTGYCNLTEGDKHVNLAPAPLPGPEPTTVGCGWYREDEIASWAADPVPTYFAGMSFTGMSREMWRRFPFRAVGSGSGCCSDWHNSWRLADAGIPIVAPKEGWIRHLKRPWSDPDLDNPQKLLLIGQIKPEVRLED